MLASFSVVPMGAGEGVKELIAEALRIVDHSAGGYHLTDQGQSLMSALRPLQAWADGWAQQAEMPNE